MQALLLGFLCLTLNQVSADFLEERIVGGENITIEEVPYHVGVRHNDLQFCGAAILTPTFVLTAALCVHATPVESLTVVTGRTDYDDETTGTVLAVKTIILHPQYNYDLKDYDIALLELVSPITYGAGSQNIAVTNTRPADGANIILTGWGDLDNGNNYTTILQTVAIPVLPDATCHAVYDGFQGQVTDRMYCAGTVGHDSCSYDTGGPAVLNKILVGVVSWGYFCALEGYPAVYTNIAHPEIRSFIKDHTGV